MHSPAKSNRLTRNITPTRYGRKPLKPEGIGGGRGDDEKPTITPPDSPARVRTQYPDPPHPVKSSSRSVKHRPDTGGLDSARRALKSLAAHLDAVRPGNKIRRPMHTSPPREKFLKMASNDSLSSDVIPPLPLLTPSKTFTYEESLLEDYFDYLKRRDHSTGRARHLSYESRSYASDGLLREKSERRGPIMEDSYTVRTEPLNKRKEKTTKRSRSKKERKGESSSAKGSYAQIFFLEDGIAEVIFSRVRKEEELASYAQLCFEDGTAEVSYTSCYT